MRTAAVLQQGGAEGTPARATRRGAWLQWGEMTTRRSQPGKKLVEGVLADTHSGGGGSMLARCVKGHPALRASCCRGGELSVSLRSFSRRPGLLSREMAAHSSLSGAAPAAVSGWSRGLRTGGESVKIPARSSGFLNEVVRDGCTVHQRGRNAI